MILLFSNLAKLGFKNGTTQQSEAVCLVYTFDTL